MQPFTDDWCLPAQGSIMYYFQSDKTTKSDAIDLFSGKIITHENTTHFGDGDIEEMYYVMSPESYHQAIYFKFSNGSMKVDKYSLEFPSDPLSSYVLEAANPATKVWDCLDHHTKKLQNKKRYTFSVPKSDVQYSLFRLRMVEPNVNGHWYIILHYFNLHGDYST